MWCCYKVGRGLLQNAFSYNKAWQCVIHMIQNSTKTAKKLGLHNVGLKDYKLYIEFMIYRRNIRNNSDIVCIVNRIVNTACYKVGRSVTKFVTL